MVKTRVTTHLLHFLHGRFYPGFGPRLDAILERVQLFIECIHVLLLSNLDSTDTGTTYNFSIFTDTHDYISQTKEVGCATNEDVQMDGWKEDHDEEGCERKPKEGNTYDMDGCNKLER